MPPAHAKQLLEQTSLNPSVTCTQGVGSFAES